MEPNKNEAMYTMAFSRRDKAQQYANRWNLENWVVDKKGKWYILRWKANHGTQPAPASEETE